MYAVCAIHKQLFYVYLTLVQIINKLFKFNVSSDNPLNHKHKNHTNIIVITSSPVGITIKHLHSVVQGYLSNDVRQVNAR